MLSFLYQAEEMTKEMEVTGGKKKAISEAVDQLRKVLFSLKEIEVDNVRKSLMNDIPGTNSFMLLYISL